MTDAEDDAKLLERLRLAEARLSDSEKKLYEAERVGRIAFWESDEATQLATWTPTGLDIVGLPPGSKLTFEMFSNLVAPPSRLTYAAAKQRSIEQQEPFDIDIEGARPDGTQFWLNVRGHPRFDDSGRFLGTSGVVMDVTERHRLTDELRAGAAFARSVMDSIDAQVGVVDRHGVIIAVNRAWRDFAADNGAPDDATDIGANYLEICRASAAMGLDDGRRAHDGISAVLTGRLPNFRMEYPCDSPSHKRWFAMSASPLDTPGGGAVIGHIDITQRKLADLRREQAASQLQATLEAAVDGIITIDADGTIRSVNGAGARMFGYAPGELIGNDVKMLMPEPYRAEHDGYMHAYHTTGVRKIIGIGREVRGRRKNGEEFYLDLAVAELPPEAGGPRYIGTLRDITARKRTEEQLRAAQKMEAVGQLTGGIAHDFNNLLAVIVGNLELLDLAGRLPPKLQTNVDTALRASHRGAELTRQLLSFGRRQALLPELVDLGGAIAEVAGLLRRTIPESIVIGTVPPPAPVFAMVDAGQLQNALMNLGLNARDAMARGGHLTFTAGVEELTGSETNGAEPVPAGRYAAISVEDDGTGMPPEVLARVFEPFFTTKPVGQGTGLGLSMVYGFLGQSGGHVRVHSEPGRGTKFSLLFPPAADVTGIAAAGKAQAEVAPQSGIRRRMLLVEDMPDVGTVIAAMLANLGYDVLLASDGAKALALLEGPDQIDGVLSDIGLPGGMTGLDLAGVAAARWPGLRIAVMSGYNDQQARSSPTGTSGLVLLRKPFGRLALAKTMAELFPDGAESQL